MTSLKKELLSLMLVYKNLSIFLYIYICSDCHFYIFFNAHNKLLLLVVAISFMTSELIDNIQYYFYDENTLKKMHACLPWK